MRSRVSTIVSAAVLLAAAACSDSTTPTTVASASAPGSEAVRSDSVPTDGPWARIIEGTTGPGSLFAIYIPRDWNGDAVYYAHGFRDVSVPVALQDQDSAYAVRDSLGGRGYAVAYSSFSENGFAVKDGAQRTHQLRGLLISELGRPPEHSFLLGASLGGGASLQLLEQYPTQYDGAMLVCGMVGGSLLQTQYVGNARVLFDFFFPGVLPGNVMGIPAGTPIPTPEQIVPIVSAALSQNPLALFAIAGAGPTPLPYVPGISPLLPGDTSATTMGRSLGYALAWHIRGMNNVLDLTHGHSPFSNDSAEYVIVNPVVTQQPVATMIASMLANAQANAPRYSFDRAALNYMEQWFTPSGKLPVPVLTLHNTADDGVPAFHEKVFLDLVTQAGANDHLVQRYYNDAFGHCKIPSAVTAHSFFDLAAWATGGSKPAPWAAAWNLPAPQ